MNCNTKSGPFYCIKNFCSLNAVYIFIMRFALKVGQRFSQGRTSPTSCFRRCENRVSIEIKCYFLPKRQQVTKVPIIPLETARCKGKLKKDNNQPNEIRMAEDGKELIRRQEIKKLQKSIRPENKFK